MLSDVDAERLGFLGSPTVRVDGNDVDPMAKSRTDSALQCRLYVVDGRLDGAPPSEWIAAALRGQTIDEAAWKIGDCCAH